MKTILRILYILIAAGIISAGLYWYGSAKAAAELDGGTTAGEVTGAGRGTGLKPPQDRNQAAAAGEPGNLPADGSVHFGGAHERINADVEILVLIRNLVWVTGTIILVLLLQAGWRKLTKRKPRVKAGSA